MILLTAESRVRLLMDALALNVGLPAWPIHGEVYKPGEWLEAVVLQESSGRPDVRRYEPQQDLKADSDRPGQDDGPLEDDASWGPMQVMGYNVRNILGGASICVLNYTSLFGWPMGMAFGLRLLRAELAATEGNVARALARYNGGPNGETFEPDGRMRCQGYVDGVEGHCGQVRQSRLDKGWRRVELAVQGQAA